MPKRSPGKKLALRRLTPGLAKQVLRVRAQIRLAINEKATLYAACDHLHTLNPRQRKLLAELGQKLHEAQRALLAFERTGSFGLARPGTARDTMRELARPTPEVLEQDPWRVYAENVVLQSENAALRRLISAKMRVGYEPQF